MKSNGKLCISIKEFCFCLYNEMHREYCYKKEFLANSIFTFIKQFIFLSGVFFTVVISSKNVILLSMLFRIYAWYSLVRTIEYATESLEREVRQQQWSGLSVNKVPFFEIYFCRYLIYNVEATLLYIICAVFFKNYISFNHDIILGANIIFFLLIIFIHNIIFYFVSITLILKYKRIGAMLGIFSFIMLFYSGMVFESNLIFSRIFYSRAIGLLYESYDSFYLQFSILLIAFAVTCFFMKVVYTENKFDGKLM